MRQLKVWKDPADDNPILLRLVQDGPDINLVVMGSDGEIESHGHLVTFWKDGTITRHSAIAGKFGFSLDDDGALDITCE